MNIVRRRRLNLLLALPLAGLAALVPGACNCDPEPDPPPTPPTAGSALTVADARVRSCEALFRVDNGAGLATLPSVTFGGAVVGETIPKAPRFALAFRAGADESLTGKDIADFGGAGFTGAVLERAVCYDGAGGVVDGTPLQLR